MLRAFLEAVPVEELKSLRQVFCSGEGLPTELSYALLRRLPHCRVHNLYGPTEASIDVSYWECKESDRDHYKITPIGKAIQNIKLYVLDQYQRVVPYGVAGELYIGGVGLALGYMKREDLTEKAFIENPFVQGGRLYRTGDLARRLEAGDIEYLGRIDHQVKLRGFRIELGEIEATLMRHKQISQAVVIVDGEGEQSKLVAYYEGERDIQLEELKAYAGEHLPEYMIPSFFIHMDILPLTHSGKIDRKTLPAINLDLPTDKYVAPESEEERQLLDIWVAVLNVDRLGVLDDFFAVGGDSILAIQLAARMAKANFQFSLTDIFKYRNIRKPR
jgi:acyl-coenzyme A synthetase/AMP-(fatty) acid ligase